MIQILIAQSDSYFLPHQTQQQWLKLHSSLTTPPQLNQFYLSLIFKGFFTSKQYPIKVIRCLKKHEQFNQMLFLDTLWSTFSLVVNSNQPNDGLAQKAAEFVHFVKENRLINNTKMMEGLGEKCLFQSKVVDEEAYNKKYRRIFTLNNFTQQKYNLMKENNQGYSKMILILFTLRKDSDPNKAYQDVIAHVGCFNLDPDRVLDLILDSFIQNPGHSRIYLPLLTRFNINSIPILIANKLGRLAADNSQCEKIKFIDSIESALIQLRSNRKSFLNDPLIPNLNLMKVSANLIKAGVFKVQEIFEILTPKLQHFYEDADRRLAFNQMKANQIFVVSTQQLTDNQKKQRELFDKNSLFGQQIYGTKLWLTHALLEVNDWEHFKDVLYLIDNKFDILTHLPILNTVFKLIDWSINPIYQMISLKKHFKTNPDRKSKHKPKSKSKSAKFHPKVTSPKFSYEPQYQVKQIQQINQISFEFFDQLEQLLKVTTSYIGFNSSLYIKICRIFRNVLTGKQLKCSVNYPIEVARQRIKIIINNYLLPAINCQISNSSLSLELFPLLTLFDYTSRMEMYTDNFTSMMLGNGYFYRQFTRVKREQNILMNTLSKDNKKQYFKKIGKLSHNHSFYLFYWVTRRMTIPDYEATIPEIVNIVGNCSKLALESFVFIIFYFITNERNSDQPIVDVKSGEVPAWFRHCYIFLGLFYRKYHQTDLMMVFGFIISKIQRSIEDIETEFEGVPGIQLKVLKELISKMSAINPHQNLNREQVLMLATGPKLQLELTTLSADIKASKKSKSELDVFLFKKTSNFYDRFSMAFYLLVNISQKRDQFVHRSTIINLQQFGAIYDQYTSSFMQFLRVIVSQCQDHQQFQKLLPEQALRQMVMTYKMPLQLSFSVARHATKNISTMSSEEFSQHVTNVYSVLGEWETGDVIIRGRYDRPQLTKYLNQYKQKWRKYIPEEFFVTFWYLTLDSICFPGRLYQQKIEELKKKMSVDKQKDLERTKFTLQKILKESENQKKKFLEATEDEKNKKRLIVPLLKTKESKESGDLSFNQFIRIFSQTCLIPRMLLEPTDALYCSKFVFHMIKCNEFSSNKSVKVIASIAETVINYLSCSTYKETLECLSLFLFQLLNVFSNWRDQNKLRNDFVTKIGTDQNMIKNNYPNMKNFLMQFFQRIGGAILSQKYEPFTIKNGLYLLDKIDVIPAFRQQAEDFEDYLKKMRGKFEDQKSMKTILDRMISMVSNNKEDLPEKQGDERKREPGSVMTGMIVQEPPAKKEDASRKSVENTSRGAPTKNLTENSKDVVVNPPKKTMEVEKEVKNRESLGREKEKEKERNAEGTKSSNVPIKRENASSGRQYRQKEVSSKNSKEDKDNRDSRDNREYKDNRGGRQVRDNRDNRETRDSRDNRDNRDNREPRDTRDTRDTRDNKEAYTSKDYRQRQNKQTTRQQRQPRQNKRFTSSAHQIQTGEILDHIPAPVTVRQKKDGQAPNKQYTHIPLPIPTGITMLPMAGLPPPPPNPPEKSIVKSPAMIVEKPVVGKQDEKKKEIEINSRFSDKQKDQTVTEKNTPMSQQQKLMERIRNKPKPQPTTSSQVTETKPVVTATEKLNQTPNKADNQQTKNPRNNQERRSAQKQLMIKRESKDVERPPVYKRDTKDDKNKWEKDDRNRQGPYQGSNDKSKRYSERDRDYDSRGSSGYNSKKRSRSKDRQR